MNLGWKTVPLQSLCNDLRQDIVDGPFGSELRRKDYITDGVPVLKIQNIHPFEIELKKMDYVSAEKYAELRRHSFRRGDIVMTKLGSPLGVSAIVDELAEGVIVADLVRIRAQQINTRYLCYHLNSNATSEYINSMQKGTTRPRVTLSVVRQLPISLPSPAEQRRIVTILDEAFEGIATAKANAEKNLQNARELFDSLIGEVFARVGMAYGRKRLGDIVERLTNGFVGPTRDIYVEQGVPYLLARHVRNNQLKFDGRTFVSAKFNEEHKKSKLKRGDVLLVQSGHIGHTAVVGSDHEGHNCHAMIVMTPVKGVLVGEYLSYFFNSPEMRESFDSIRSGSTVPHLTCGAVKELGIPIPAVDEQRRLVGRLDELQSETSRLRDLIAAKYAAFEELKKSLLHQAFTGALRAKSADRQLETVA